VFSNDQQGQPRLLRSLATSFEPEEITVTSNGYMIVTGNNGFLAIYRATAKGNQQPLATLTPNGGSIYGLTSDASHAQGYAKRAFAYRSRVAVPHSWRTLVDLGAHELDSHEPRSFFLNLAYQLRASQLATELAVLALEFGVAPCQGLRLVLGLRARRPWGSTPGSPASY
jgi:hypothetical protein